MRSRSFGDEVHQSTFEVEESLLGSARKAGEPDFPLSSSRVGADGVLEDRELGLKSNDGFRWDVGREVDEPTTDDLNRRVVEVDGVGGGFKLSHDVGELREKSKKGLRKEREKQVSSKKRSERDHRLEPDSLVRLRRCLP